MDVGTPGEQSRSSGRQPAEARSNVTRGVYRHVLADEMNTAALVFDKLYGASS